LEQMEYQGEKEDLFCLILAVLRKDGVTLNTLWNHCNFIYNEVHLVILVNLIFEAVWQEGLKVIFRSEFTRDIFNYMNHFEKNHFLEFCFMSIQ